MSYKISLSAKPQGVHSASLSRSFRHLIFGTSMCVMQNFQNSIFLRLRRNTQPISFILGVLLNACLLRELKNINMIEEGKDDKPAFFDEVHNQKLASERLKSGGSQKGTLDKRRGKSAGVIGWQ